MEITGLDLAFNSLNNYEWNYSKDEDRVNKDLNDMLEYVRILTD